ncbi:MAG: MATE family efflux transporter [Hyphomicrobiales bacterium]
MSETPSVPTDPPKPREAKFTTGSTMRHVVVMTLTSSVGLMAIFLVDFADMYFLSILGENEVAGAIGFSGAIIFINLSIGIGLSISITALVAQALGAGKEGRAQRLAASTLLFAFLFTSLVTLFLWIFTTPILTLLGAKGETLKIAESYLRIVIPSFPLLGIGICLSGILRALGDAKRAMYVTLSGGVTNAVLDPILIFTAGLGVEGAAIASVCARVAIVIIGTHGAHHVHGFLIMPSFAALKRHLKPILSIALPAMATQIATPVGNAYVTYAMAPYGPGAVAALAVIGRIVPVAFGVVFSLSGAVGPIIGQNFGAKRFGRIKQTYYDAVKFGGVYVCFTAALLFILRDYIALAFNASDQSAYLISFFCTFIGVSWLFAGLQFVSNAAFNNLGRAHYSTLFNWGKSTIGTIPFVIGGASLWGAPGVLAGQAVGHVIFGLAAFMAGRQLISKLARSCAAYAPRGR